MAVFIQVTTDPFEETRQDAQQTAPGPAVRRPLRGIQIKRDTYAVLRAMTVTGEELPLFDSSSTREENGIGRSSGGTANFIAQTIQESRMEKQQIVETFGEDYIFFFGERPRFITVQGILLNTADFNWKSEFWENYENYLRGTKLVEQNARLYFYFDDVVVEGYLVQASTTHQVMSPYHMPFNFQMFVCNYATLSTVGSVFFQQNAQNAVPQEGLTPPDDESQAALADQAARQGASGGLSSFLASTQQFIQDASFSVQSTLENIRNTFYGRNLVVPQGIGNQQVLKPITNQASFEPAPINQPIYDMADEYVDQPATQLQLDQKEQDRVRQELKLRDPEELERRARAELEKRGIDTTRRETEYLLLGRAAFAGLQTFGSFGIRQADGVLTNI